MIFTPNLLISLFIISLYNLIGNFGVIGVEERYVKSGHDETWLEDEVAFFREDGENNSTPAANFAGKCIKRAKCFSDADCGIKGKCVGGTKIGKCDCSKCRTGFICKHEDSKTCGGLKDACSKFKLCQCEQAYKKHGYENAHKVRTEFCGVKSCNWNNDECFGLPCKAGNCRCGKV
ncbi:unnamed protein product [Meloidogyne enterolobii]|uniref:Uncharacterized protein n=1 Tax=Meloidogyne enterolobii TaxID=390850 RepID=A0ACB1AR84_MELEN